MVQNLKFNKYIFGYLILDLEIRQQLETFKVIQNLLQKIGFLNFWFCHFVKDYSQKCLKDKITFKIAKSFYNYLIQKRLKNDDWSRRQLAIFCKIETEIFGEIEKFRHDMYCEKFHRRIRGIYVWPK